jgi:hypothetical protein
MRSAISDFLGKAYEIKNCYHAIAFNDVNRLYRCGWLQQ